MWKKETIMKAAIFDMDGTLVDSMPYWRGHMQSYLGEYDLEATQDDIERLINQAGSFRFIFDRIKVLDPSLTWEGMVENYHSRMRKEYETAIGLKPYVLDYLKQLKAQNIPMCIATATPRELFLPMVARLGLDAYFEFYITVPEIGKRKSEPDIYLYCAEKFGYLPKECTVFEDTIQAITTAFNAGFKTMGIYDEASAWAEEKIRQNATKYIHSYKELLV